MHSNEHRATLIMSLRRSLMRIAVMSLTCRVAILHQTSQAERPHVGPHFLDERQALCLRAALPRVAPPERVLAVGRPDGVLLFLVKYDLIDRRTFFLLEHVTSLV